MIARQTIGAGLILDLHHDDRVLRIDLAQMMHQRGKGLAVGLQRFTAERRKRIMKGSVFPHHARETPVVQLDPARRILRVGVFPGGKPQQHQPQVPGAGLFQQRVDHRKVEMPLLRLDLLPGDGHFHRVDVERLHRRPDTRQGTGPGAGIVGLRAQHQERRSIDDQRMAPLLLHDMGRVACLGDSRDGRHKQRGKQTGDHLAQAVHPALASQPCLPEWKPVVTLSTCGRSIRFRP